jgi:hypothetical protein
VFIPDTLSGTNKRNESMKSRSTDNFFIEANYFEINGNELKYLEITVLNLSSQPF